MTSQDLDNDEISLLDLALTVAENLRLLIIGPIAAGLIALGASSLLPKTFESVAILNVIDQPEKVASLTTSAAVLDPVAEQLGLTKSATGTLRGPHFVDVSAWRLAVRTVY
uniref:Wzz/FepE/Etk N-terminal domain-containing protein n=1 Tax=Shewanella sp. TaxID=50422 RepID=UPI00404842C6